MSGITTINTIRHAQTDFGLEKRYAGSLDIPLNEGGLGDCKAAAAALAGTIFDAVITSRLRRAIETGRLLAPMAPMFVQTHLCNEREFGVMEGLTWDQVRLLEPRILFIEVGNDLHSVNPQGGEPFERVWRRAERFRRHLFKEHRNSRILVVSHGVFLQMFHGLLRGLNCIESLATPYPSNLEFTSFHLSGLRLVGEEVVKLTGAIIDEDSF